MVSPEKDNWQTAMQDEVNSLNEIPTRTLVDKPQRGKVLTGRWL